MTNNAPASNPGASFLQPLARTAPVLAAALVRSSVALLPVASVAALPVAPAHAAVTAVTPYHVATSKGDVKVRSGAGGVWYAVASLKANTALRVDAESEGWLRVSYLPGMSVVVKAADAEKRADGTVVLRRPSALSALDMADPFMEACYKVVLDERLPPGTALRFLGDVTDRTGKVDGYRVEAPAAARGWVAAGDVKKISDAEAARLGASAAPATTGAPAPVPASTPPAPPSASPSGNPAATPAQPQPQPVPVQPAPVQPVPVQPAPAEATGGAAPTVPVTTTGEPAPGAATPVESAPTEPAVTEPAVTEPPKPREPTPEEIRAREIARAQQARRQRLNNLDEAFRAVAAQPVESAEFEPLLNEYEKFKAELNGQLGSDPAAGRMINHVDNRMELLRLRGDLQEKYRKMGELRSRADQVMANINSGIQQIQASRRYLVVGRLTTSAMYDGTRLPKLYRVQSVDTNVQRTLAYLTPVEGQQLEMKLGMIVGVKGDGPIDPSAKVGVLVPTQVDILRNADGTPMGGAVTNP